MAQCIICCGEWTSGEALLDGSVFHGTCYAALLTEVDTLPRREEELLSELGVRRKFFESWKRWFVPTRRQFASVPLLTDDSQIGANLRVCADEEDRADFDRRG